MLTPVNITVMRFTQDGIDENVMLVPLVDATAVPDVRTLLAIVDTTAPDMVGLVSVLLVRVCVVTRSTSVEVLDGSVSVLLDATAAASICVKPEVDPLSLIGIRQCSKLTQMER